MVEKKKIIIKTVNRSGKALIKKALVVKTKKQSNITAENIKKANEKIKAEKEMIKKQEAMPKAVSQEASQENKKYTLSIGLKDLLDAGSHLGHKASKTNPKAKENIYTIKDGVGVFDLVKTMSALEKACNFIHNAKRNGKKILFLGTKRQAREAVRRVALEVGAPYVTDRWLGGTITNWDQIKRNIKKLVELKDGMEKGKFTESTKKELSVMNKEIVRLEKKVGGLVSLDKIFDILFVVDSGFEKTAIKEAKIKGIKVVAITDSDSNPLRVDYAIPANDDSVKSINLIVEEIGKALK
jgi:small subunit ribosomal protein S2